MTPPPSDHEDGSKANKANNEDNSEGSRSNPGESKDSSGRSSKGSSKSGSKGRAVSRESASSTIMERNTGVAVDEAQRKVIARLAMIETTRPLETITDNAAREQATLVRDWYHRVFTRTTP